MATITRRKSFGSNEVLSAGFLWVKDDTQINTVWRSNTDGYIAIITKRSNHNYFWTLVTPESAPEVAVSGNTSAEAFWHAADDVRKAVKSL